MTHYPVAQAKDELEALIHRASHGESVSIVSANGAIATLVVHEDASEQPRSAHDHDWFDRVRIKPRYPSNSVELIQAMRAEYRY